MHEVDSMKCVCYKNERRTKLRTEIENDEMIRLSMLRLLQLVVVDIMLVALFL